MHSSQDDFERELQKGWKDFPVKQYQAIYTKFIWHMRQKFIEQI